MSDEVPPPTLPRGAEPPPSPVAMLEAAASAAIARAIRIVRHREDMIEAIVPRDITEHGEAAIRRALRPHVGEATIQVSAELDDPPPEA